jgi:DNA-binding GntR family transcriptional regulator
MPVPQNAKGNDMAILDKIRLEQPPTIREEVYKYLRRKILAGDFNNDERLIEAKLAEEIGTSRTPVREALHKLEMENLVQSIPRVGYVVNEINDEEIEEILEIRFAIETLAAKWAAEKISAAELNRLDEIIELTNQSIAAQDTDTVIELDAEFHDIICKASRSRRLEEMSQTLRDHMLRFRLKGLWKPEIAARSNEGHRRISQAIREKNMLKIEEAFRFHLSRTREDVMERIQIDQQQAKN